MRILIVHPEPATRATLEQTLRRLTEGAVSIHQASSAAEGLEGARRIDPGLVLLELDQDTELVLDAARELRRPGRLIAGLYNPLLRGASEIDFFRAASRAGVADFVPVPAPEDELQAVLEAASPQTAETPREGRVVTFVSHKGGVGKTTLAVATALAAAESGSADEVVLCDADLQFGDAAAHLGLAPPQDLAALAGDLGDLQTLSTYVTVHPPSDLRVLASPREAIDADRVTPEQMSRILIALTRRFPLVVVDTASQIDLISLAVLDLSDQIFVVTEAVAPTVLGTARLLALLDGQGFEPERLRVVVNRYTRGDDNLALELVAERIGRPVDHVVDYDRGVPVGTHRGEPQILGQRRAALSRTANQIAAGAVREG